ncbi:MAG: DUF4198 domain-containing protein [Aliifodinibius sp.]|nr:DUF4198 domain-containing protein [candidate division Zixibacteria bacterium]NIT60360.1 DUF4198 domain-containing protein [Fodinibius sp.]NIW43122.1 DUF4198 domain-containing protein [candidate division Zixibacteria bacterium]NIX58586.1 DUF4198 domain-containing protein [candidate division Zixibacteria bacterium]NIY28942.1 DUF4198 domain-containing protein [Fodinibius sp.]
MKNFLFSIILIILTLSSAHAHFALVLPSDNIISPDETKQLEIEVKFVHPFEGFYMDMKKPRQFGLLRGGQRIDLLDTLEEATSHEKRVWRTKYRIRRPGDHIFFLEPSPYWEPAEKTFIIHYTKVVVGALGLEDGWHAEVGLPVEIIPLTRPYGLWSGNVFQGIVRRNGSPVPFASIEVEYYNSSGKVKAPAFTFITQTIRADSDGVFTYAMPREGWWGFAALMEADYTIKREGKDYPVELGAVIWVHAHSMSDR